MTRVESAITSEGQAQLAQLQVEKLERAQQAEVRHGEEHGGGLEDPGRLEAHAFNRENG